MPEKTVILTRKKHKTVSALREHLKTLMVQNKGGGWKNPFSQSEPENIYPYRSYAVDSAMKYFMAAEEGENRRVSELGEEWKEIA